MKYYTHKAWEQRVHSLLTVRYSTGDYQRVPDQHGGDFGVESFSLDGRAYQCYAPVEPLDTKRRYEAHRDKITADIGKFIHNKVDLQRLFGGLVMHRWILVVPYYDSGPLIQHAAEKTAQVKAANLPYVSDDFRIAVLSEEDFAVERKLLEGSTEAEVHYIAPEIADPERELDSDRPVLLQNLRRKSRKISSLTEKNRPAFEKRIAQNYLGGQKILDEMRRDHPNVYEAVFEEKAARAHALETESLLSTAAPGDRITSEVAAFNECLAKRFPQISTETRQFLTMEAVADWLLICPLDFSIEEGAHE